MRIDVQCHIFPEVIERYLLNNPFPKCMRLEGRLLCDFGSQKIILPDFQYKPENIISAMDKGGVDVSLISANIPDPGFLEPEQSAELCTEINCETKAISEKFEKRFIGLGFIPWNNPQKAEKEIANVKKLGLKGIMLFTRNGNLQVDDKALEPVYYACEAEKLPLFIHPTIPMWHEPIGDYGMVATVSFVMDTAYAFIRLCNSGILDRHPDLNVVIPHAGGVLPILDGRLGYVPPAARAFVDPNKRTVLDTLFSGQAWFDLANPSLKVLKYFKEYLGLDRAMYGTDYPFVDQDYMTDLLDKLDLTQEEKNKIDWQNANELFKLGL